MRLDRGIARAGGSFRRDHTVFPTDAAIADVTYVQTFHAIRMPVRRPIARIFGGMHYEFSNRLGIPPRSALV
jgi:hypothetical protein